MSEDAPADPRQPALEAPRPPAAAALPPPDRAAPRPPVSPASLARAALVVGVVGYLALGLVAGVLAARSNTLRPRRPHAPGPPAWGARAARSTMQTRDGLRLSVLAVAPRPGRPVLLVLHGVANNYDGMVERTRPFVEAGYGALTLDWRANGDSEGEVTSYGQHEVEDLRAALAALRNEPGLEGPVGVVAESMGASVAAMGAGLMGGRVRCMVLDSPYGSIPRMLEARLAVLGPVSTLSGVAARAYSRWALGLDLDAVVPEDHLPAFAPRPVFFLHGQQDRVTPFSEALSIHGKYPGEKQSWFSERDGHCQTARRDRPGWTREVAAFLARHLPGAPAADEVVGQLEVSAAEG